MRLEYTVSVEVQRLQGKFASKDEISEAIESELDSTLGGLDISGIGADGSTDYEVTDYTVERNDGG